MSGQLSDAERRIGRFWGGGTRGWGRRSGRKGRETSLKGESNGSRNWVGGINRDSRRLGGNRGGRT